MLPDYEFAIGKACSFLFSFPNKGKRFTATQEKRNNCQSTVDYKKVNTRINTILANALSLSMSEVCLLRNYRTKEKHYSSFGGKQNKTEIHEATQIAILKRKQIYTIFFLKK